MAAARPPDAIELNRARLVIVREIQENDSGAMLHFQQGGQGCLARSNANFETHLRLAWRSQERQHPIGVRFGEGQTIAELLRADNDVPTQLCEGSDCTQVYFQGHDGVFRLKGDHSESTRLRALLSEAIWREARLWFIALKPELALADILPTERDGERIT